MGLRSFARMAMIARQPIKANPEWSGGAKSRILIEVSFQDGQIAEKVKPVKAGDTKLWV
jgi:hypothetical protein